MKEKLSRKARMHYKNFPVQGGYKKVPWLNLAGLWLEKAGFQISDAIEISVSNKRLIINKVGCYSTITEQSTREILTLDKN